MSAEAGKPSGRIAPMRVRTRLGKVRARLGSAGCDGLLVTSLVNLRYLTGFSGSAALLLVTKDGAVMTTDGRYGEQINEETEASGTAPLIDKIVVGGLAAQREALVGAAAPLARLGLEAAHVTWAEQRGWVEALDGVELVATTGIVEGLRRVKDAGEIGRIGRAAAIADAALARCVPSLREAPSEERFAAELDHAMRLLGAAGSSFPTIVASGPNAAKPHAQPSHRRIGTGECIVVDFGAIYDGYCSDMTRTFCVGEPADPTVAKMIDVVTRSQRAGVKAVRAGASCASVDGACRAVIDAEGWKDAFSHGTGHGVGLEIHEDPAVAPRAPDSLEPGTIVTVEPGVYLPGIGGVRIEDTVVVTENGCRVLTSSPKDVFV